jgi:hypothetical protein
MHPLQVLELMVRVVRQLKRAIPKDATTAPTTAPTTALTTTPTPAHPTNQLAPASSSIAAAGGQMSPFSLGDISTMTPDQCRLAQMMIEQQKTQMEIQKMQIQMMQYGHPSAMQQPSFPSLFSSSLFPPGGQLLPGGTAGDQLLQQFTHPQSTSSRKRGLPADAQGSASKRQATDGASASDQEEDEDMEDDVDVSEKGQHAVLSRVVFAACTAARSSLALLFLLSLSRRTMDGRSTGGGN